ncbi:FAD binding domain-containing protein [Colletotrichum asianum]
MIALRGALAVSEGPQTEKVGRACQNLKSAFANSTILVDDEGYTEEIALLQYHLFILLTAAARSAMVREVLARSSVYLCSHGRESIVFRP